MAGPIGDKNIYDRSLKGIAGGHAFDSGLTLADALKAMPAAQRAYVEKFANKMPKGLNLAPVIYTKISSNDNQKAYKEYNDEPRKAMFILMGTVFKDKAKTMGFDDHAIKRMAGGRSPVSSAGKAYKYNIDHVMERGGAGLLSDGSLKEVDKRASEALGYQIKTRPNNHVDNLTMLRNDDHKIKTKMVRHQVKGMKNGESRLIVMPVPDRELLSLVPANFLRQVKEKEAKAEKNRKASQDPELHREGRGKKHGGRPSKGHGRVVRRGFVGTR